MLLRQCEPIDAILGRAIDYLVVDIGEVLNSFDVDPAVLHVRLHNLKDHGRQRVPQMRFVVRGNPAHVHSHRVGNLFELFFLASERIVEQHDQAIGIGLSRFVAKDSTSAVGYRTKVTIA